MAALVILSTCTATAGATSARAATPAPGAVTGPGGKCVDVDHSGTANGTAVQLWTCNGSGAQKWTMDADGSVRALGKCLDVSGSGTADGTLTQLYDCNGSAAQQWLVTTGNDLVNPHADKCLDATGGSSADGTRLQIWSCTGAAAQKWTPPARPATSKRVIVYYQTQYQGSTYFSPAALLDNKTRTTDVVVAAFHLNGDGSVHLNDDPPSAAKFTPMWADLARMQAAGVRVEAMVGGAAPGSFTNLDTRFDQYYPLLRNVITTYHLDGVDLDVEESMSLAGMER